EIEDGRDIPVAERGGQFGLSAESLYELLVSRELLPEHLQRHVAADAHLLCEIDGAHPALAELAGHSVAALQHLPDEGALCGKAHRSITRFGDSLLREPNGSTGPPPIPRRIRHSLDERQTLRQGLTPSPSCHLLTALARPR